MSMLFLREFVTHPALVGTVAPSGVILAKLMCREYEQSTRSPLRVLEAGAGTGAVTRYLGRVLRPTDRLDICEINPHFADRIEERVLSEPSMERARSEGRVRLLRQPVQTVPSVGGYDMIICALPFSAFDPPVIREIFTAFERLLKPDGMLSYIELLWFRKLSLAFSNREVRARRMESTRVLNDYIARYQYDEAKTMLNVPPAMVRYLRFDHAAVGPETNGHSHHGRNHRAFMNARKAKAS